MAAQSYGTQKVKDIHEWLAQIGIPPPSTTGAPEQTVTYHEACHLCHGQKITVAATPSPAGNSESEAGGIAGEHLVLRQRGHLQSHSTGNGRGTFGSQTQAHQIHRAPPWSRRAIRAACCKSSTAPANKIFRCASRIPLLCWLKRIAKEPEINNRHEPIRLSRASSHGG